MNDKEKKDINLENNGDTSNDFGLKWGEETIQNDVSNYTYQDPNQPINEEKTEGVKESTLLEQPSSSDATSIQEEENKTEQLGAVLKPKDEMPISTVEESIQSDSISQGSNMDAKNQESPTTMEASITNREPVQDGGKKSSIGLILLFVCLLLFVFFLPEITNYINLIRTRQEVQGSPTHTATPSPIAPSPSSVPTPSPKPVISLENVVDRFNRSQMVQEIKEKDEQIVLHATQKEGIMTIDYQVPVAPTSRSSTYERKESILSSTNADMTTATILVEVISQLQGNEKGIGKMIFEGDLTQYSLSENGISIEVNPNETLTIKIDLSKQLEISNRAIGVK